MVLRGLTLSRRRRVRWPVEGVVGIGLLALLLISGLWVQWFGSPYRLDLNAVLLPPGTAGHLFGTDQLGRDLLSRVLVGLRVSTFVATAAAAISVVLGVTLGMTSGYFGGRVDALIMRLADVQLAVPFILLTLLVISVLGASMAHLIAVLGVTGWVTYARVARGQTLAVRHHEYVQAARALGASDRRIIVRHVLRNILVPLLVVLTLDLSRLVLLEAAMSFLGFGVQPPTPSLGSLVGEGRTLIALAWWPVTYPGLVLALYVLAVNLVGDALADRVNVGGGR